MDSLVIFSKFTELCNHHDNWVLEHLCPTHPATILHACLQLIPLPPPPQMTTEASCLAKLPILDTLRKWSQIACGLLVSGLFWGLWHSSMLQCVSILHSFLWLKNIPLLDIPHIVYVPTRWEPFRLFPLSGYNAAVQSFGWTYVFISLG